MFVGIDNFYIYVFILNLLVKLKIILMDNIEFEVLVNYIYFILNEGKLCLLYFI